MESIAFVFEWYLPVAVGHSVAQGSPSSEFQNGASQSSGTTGVDEMRDDRLMSK